MTGSNEAAKSTPYINGNIAIESGVLPLLKEDPQALMERGWEERGGYIGARMEDYTKVSETKTTIGNLVAQCSGRVAIGPHALYPDYDRAFGIWVTLETEVDQNQAIL